MISRSHVEATQVPKRKATMDSEVEALVSRLGDANIVTDKWVFTIKYHPDGTIVCHKACLVAYGFTQAYDINYTETFSLIIRLNYVCMLLSLAVNQAWSLHQLDVSNTFIYSDLKERVFLEQPPRYVSQGGVIQGVFPVTSYLWTQAESTCLVCQV